MMLYAIPLGVGAFLYALIVLLFGQKMEDKDAIERRLNDLGNTKKETRISVDAVNQSFTTRVLKPLFSKIGGILAKLLPMKNTNDGSNKQKQQLEQAGLSISVEDYLAIQFVVMLGGGLLALGYGILTHVQMSYRFLYFGGGIFGAYTILRYGLASKVTSRKAAMEKQLPDMLDLLSVSVEAGLAFERAMLHVTESMEGPLIDEVTVTYREMSMGRSRKEALTLLGERCGIEDLSSFTSAVVQAGQLGIPLRNVLHAQSEALRRSRKAKVQEKAAKVSTKILIPMVIFIFPVLFIVLLGPSMISIMGNL